MRKAKLEGKKCSIHDVKMTCWLQLEEFKSSFFSKNGRSNSNTFIEIFVVKEFVGS